MRIIVILLILSINPALAKQRPVQTINAELIAAAHKVLELGMDCQKNGASHEACHAALTTAIRKRGYQ